MQNIIPFDFNSNEMRAIVIDGEPWFVASEICNILGYSNSRDAVSRHCKGVVKHDIPTTSGLQSVSIIPERDLYRLVMRSRLPEAESFENWVVSEVLPSIRKNGGYIAGQENTDDPELIMARALQVAQNIIDKKSKELELANTRLIEQKPKVDYYNTIVTRENLLNATQVAQKVKLSAVMLNKHLESFGVYNSTIKRSRAFKLWFVDKGLGVMRQTELGYPQAMFTMQGEAWVIEKLISEGIV